MWELDHKEGWAPKNWCIRIVGLGKTLESPLDKKEIKPVNPKGNQPWIFTGRTDAEAEVPILWPPDAKNWLIGKDPDAGKDWRQEEKGATEDEMVGWHHQLNGHAFEQTLGDSERQGNRVFCSPGGSQRVGHDLATKQQQYIVMLGFLGGSVVKNLPATTWDGHLFPGSRRSSGKGNGNPLQYSCLGNPMDKGV